MRKTKQGGKIFSGALASSDAKKEEVERRVGASCATQQTGWSTFIRNQEIPAQIAVSVCGL